MEEVQRTIKDINRQLTTKTYQFTINTTNKTVKQFLNVLCENGAVEQLNAASGGLTKVKLNSEVKFVGIVTPPINVKTKKLGPLRRFYLPDGVMQRGRLVLTTSKGIIDDVEAVRLQIGGKVFSYFF